MTNKDNSNHKTNNVTKGKRSLDKPILQLVQKFEKFNSNPASDRKQNGKENGSTGRNETNKTLEEDLVSAEIAITSDIGDQLCFKSAQLMTELLLIIFAACLLIIAAIVIFSKKIPAIMESYDIIPKFLFFLCIIAAAYSFIRWLFSKIYPIISLQSMFKELNHSDCVDKRTAQKSILKSNPTVSNNCYLKQQTTIVDTICKEVEDDPKVIINIQENKLKSKTKRYVQLDLEQTSANEKKNLIATTIDNNVNSIAEQETVVEVSNFHNK